MGSKLQCLKCAMGACRHIVLRYFEGFGPSGTAARFDLHRRRGLLPFISKSTYLRLESTLRGIGSPKSLSFEGEGDVRIVVDKNLART